jgi:hypothetical protein
MSDPKPTPPPRNRKARRKSSPGQVAFLQYKAVRDKAKAEREAKQRLDGWYLHHFHPEIAQAKRAKGVKNNAEASAWRRQSFVESFTDWPSVLTAGEMGYRIREWLRDRSVLNPTTGRRKWKWRGCEKNFVKTEVSVRKKLTELEVFRYNFRERLWFKCGSVEEAEATQRLAEQEAERRRLDREEAERVERERLNLVWEADRKRRQEAERLKAEAEQAERDRLSRPAVSGWHDFIPEELKPTALAYFMRNRRLAVGEGLDDLPTSEAEKFLRQDRAYLLGWLQDLHDAPMRRLAEAVLVGD